ncbi:glycosyltransferase family 4 protein [Weeksellaceae bacterium TAE3-ERU29]|nr:glycosyltransferase family 4 protein [Weeksellaceae bacterium TAE3-ERU29]
MIKTSAIKIIRSSTVPVSLDILLKGQLQYLNQFYNIKAVSGKGKNLENVKNREGVEVIELEMQRQISPMKDFISLVKMYFLLKKEKPTIVHSITPKGGLITMLAGKLAGVPVRIHTFTGLIFPYREGFMQKLLIYMDRLLCASATHIFPEGDGVKKNLIKYKITQKPLEIIANGNVNGIDTEHYSKAQISPEIISELKNKYNLKDTDFIYCFVGRLVKDKGITELINAFSSIKEPNTKLILVGRQEPHLDPLDEKTIQEIESNPNIISVGFQSDIRPFLAVSDCFVFPSYREGFPNVVLQAQSMELPCIVTDISGSNEIIQQNVNGIIINKKDEEALKQSMIELKNNNNFLIHLKQNTRNNIIEKYSQKLVWESLHQKYEEILHQLK